MSCTDPIASVHHQGEDIVDVDDEQRNNNNLLKSFYARHQVSTDFLCSSRNSNSNDSNNNNSNCTDECGRYRFIRLNPRYNQDETLALLRTELSSNQNNNQGRKKHDNDDADASSYPIQVSWLDSQWGFYALPPNFKLAQSICFRQGRVYGQDVSSGAAVAALFSNNSHIHIHHHHQQQQQQQQQREPLRVLDLCCAPGLKLCAMADWLSRDDKQHNNPPISTTADHQEHSSFPPLSSLTPALLAPVIVGVDISASRMAVCKRVVEKYHIDTETCGQNDTTTCHPCRARIRMYCTDGTTFGILKEEDNIDHGDDETKKVNCFSSSLVFDSEASLAQQNDDRISSSSSGSGGGGTKRKRLNKSGRARLGKRLKQVAQLDYRLEEDDGEKCNDKGDRIAVKLFDRVLVDAECSTDGSLKHVQKRMQKELKCKIAADEDIGKNIESMAHSNFLQTLTSKQHLDELVNLQKRLAGSGFRLLKPGGFMVYSTCSLCVEQNEEVVEWLLKEYEDQATLVPIDFGGGRSLLQIQNCGLVKETNNGMITFLPNTNSDELCGGGFFLAKLQKKTTHNNNIHVGDDDSQNKNGGL